MAGPGMQLTQRLDTGCYTAIYYVGACTLNSFWVLGLILIQWGKGINHLIERFC